MTDVPFPEGGAQAGSAEESLKRAEELLARLERPRDELERAATSDDPEAAIDVLTQLAELARAVESELQRAKSRAES